MFQGLVSSASHLLQELRRKCFTSGDVAPKPNSASAPAVACWPLERILLTDGVGRTLFEEYACHRAADRGNEETGWLLLGLRDQRQAIALATLPAGLRADTSVSHVQFNTTAQAVGSRIVRQTDRRLTTLGLVHTHPGSLRHPSNGDLRGDRAWVQALRGQEGVFGIGTADADSTPLYGQQPRPNVQCLGELRFSWYSLRRGASAYRPLPVSFTLGPDLARRLHAAWATLEEHAERLERLYQQLARLQVEVVDGPAPGLLLLVALPGGRTLRVLLSGQTVRYFLERAGELFEADHHDELVDRGVYRLLAELAQEA